MTGDTYGRNSCPTLRSAVRVDTQPEDGYNHAWSMVAGGGVWGIHQRGSN